MARGEIFKLSNRKQQPPAAGYQLGASSQKLQTLRGKKKYSDIEDFKMEVLLHYARRFFVYSFNSRFQVPKADLESFVAA